MFPNLTESTVRPWVRNYREELENKSPMHEIAILQRRGLPLYLSSELDLKLQKFLINSGKAGVGVNRHVVSGDLLGLIKSDLESYGSLLNFNVIDGRLQSLYKRMNFSRRTAKTSRPVITKSIWEEVRTTFLHDIVSVCIEYDILD